MNTTMIGRNEDQKRQPFQKSQEHSRANLRCFAPECDDFGSTSNANSSATSVYILQNVSVPRSLPNSPEHAPRHRHYHSVLSRRSSVPAAPVTHIEPFVFNLGSFLDSDDDWSHGNGSITQTPQSMIVTPTRLLPSHDGSWGEVAMSVRPIPSPNGRQPTRRGECEIGILSERVGAVDLDTYSEISFSLQYVLPSRKLEITMEAIKTDECEIHAPNINYFGKISLSLRGHKKIRSQNIVLGQTVHFKCTGLKLATGMYLTLQLMTRALTCTGHKVMGESSISLDEYNLSSRTAAKMNLIHTRTERSEVLVLKM